MSVGREEQVKMQLDVLLEEYKCIKADISQNTSVARQMTNLTITTAGILIAGTPFIIQNQLPTLFLVAPFLFYALAWIQQRCIFVEHHLTHYLADVLVPQIHEILKDSSTGSQNETWYQKIMSWETYFRKEDSDTGPLMIAVAHGASNAYGLTLFIAFLSIVAYVSVVYQSRSVLLIDWMLLVANLVVFVYTVALGLELRFPGALGISLRKLFSPRRQRG